MIRIMIIMMFLSFIGGAFGGYNYRDMQAEAEARQAIDKAVADYVARVEATRKVEELHHEQQEKTKTVYKTIIKKVKEYVPISQSSDSDCNLTLGTVRMLDASAKNALPDAAAAFDETDKAASRFNELALIEFAHATANRFNEVKDQCNSLIDWIEADHAAND